ncbi:cytochrome P450 [Granulicella sp. WH15]|uniref:cytochrome P450 n=1 Tax=Granulicella sp. WH15 TaxID=2602070 RepID=UPI00136754AA|nr:cytochrome P450 [Granulicella sp. WH15]QHN03300.1 cytochrome P450 [Granulicella sp. WH15]
MESRPLPGLRFSLPFYSFKPWVKMGDPIRLFVHLKKTFGNVAHYKFMGTPIVFINEPDYIREILVTQASAFVKERTVRRMKLLLGEGLITSDDPIHIRQRRIAAPAFHRQRIAAYADQIVAIAAHQRDRWQPGATFDIAASSMALSLEIVARTLFDTEVDADIRSINDEVNAIMALYNFIVAFPKIEQFMFLPVPGIVKFRRSKRRLDAVVERLIREHREYSAQATAEGREPDRGDLLSMLLSSRDELLDDNGNPTGESVGMSDSQVRDEVLTIFLAGYETVANALTWTWYLLSQNPEAEAKMHAELDAVLGTGDAQRLPTLADYPQLRYTEQVFAESMRLYPPAWAMGRMSTREITLGPYTIPAGAHVFFSQYLMGRDPDHFPDPERFDPDRFTPEAKAARHKYAYFPFGGGSRQCIGESFAWMEGTLSLAVIAQRWRLRFVPTYPVEVQPKITLRPKYPMMMQATQR